MTIEEFIEAVMAEKSGDTDIAIFVMPGLDEPLRIMVGNPSNCVMLGEIGGQIEVDGEDIQDLFALALRRIRTGDFKS